MPNVPGLRSPYVKVGRLVYFGRMLDKIRLHAAQTLPAGDYAANLGKGFDGRCCNFLRIKYDDLKARTLAGGHRSLRSYRGQGIWVRQSLRIRAGEAVWIQ